MSVLSAEKLIFYRKNNFTLGPVDLDLPRSGLFSLIGPNGSGKSTLLQLLAGILRPFKGEISLYGSSLSNFKRKELAARLAYLPQNISPLYSFPVKKIVEMGRFPLGCNPPSINKKAVWEAMEKTGVVHLADMSFSKLSGGERQRVLLASLLSRKTELLLLDEPVNGLDPHYAVEFLKLLQKETRKNCTALLVSHDLNLAAAFSDKLILMDKGKILIEGSSEELFYSSYIKKLYGKNLRAWPHCDGEKGAVILPERSFL